MKTIISTSLVQSIQMTIQFNNSIRRWESFKWWMGALELESHFNLNKNMIVTFRWRLHLASNPLSWEQFPFVEISAGEGRELSHILRGIIEAPGERSRGGHEESAGWMMVRRGNMWAGWCMICVTLHYQHTLPTSGQTISWPMITSRKLSDEVMTFNF